jgi:hypothetical protein
MGRERESRQGIHRGGTFNFLVAVCMERHYLCNGMFTQTVIFSVGCDSRIRHCTKNRILPIFCEVSDAAVASDTENCVHVNRP